MKKLILIILSFFGISNVVDAQLAKWVLNPYDVNTPTYHNMEWLEEQNLYKVQNGKGLWGFLDERGNPLLKPAFENIEPFENGVAIVTDAGKQKLVGFITEDCEFQDYSKYNLNLTVNGTEFKNNRLLLKYADEKPDGSYVYLLLDNIKNKQILIEGSVYYSAYPYVGEFASAFLVDKEHPEKNSFVCLRNGVNFFYDGTSSTMGVSTIKGLRDFSIKKISYISSAFRYNDGNGEHENIFLIINGICCRYDVETGNTKAIVYKKYNPKKNISTDELVTFKGSAGHGEVIKAEGAEFHFDDLGRLKETVYDEKDPHTEIISLVPEPEKAVAEKPSSIWSTYSHGSRLGLMLNSNHATVLPPQFSDVVLTRDNYAVVKTAKGRCGIIEVDTSEPSISGEINGGNTVNFYAEREDSELKLYLPKHITNDMISELFSCDYNSSIDLGIAPGFNDGIKTHNVYSSNVRLFDRDLEVMDGRIMCNYGLIYDNIISDTIKVAFDAKFVKAWKLNVEPDPKIIRRDSTYTLIVKYSFNVVQDLQDQVTRRNLATSITGVFPKPESYYTKYNLNPRVETESQVSGKIEFQLTDVMNETNIAKEDLNVPISLELRQGNYPIQSFTDFISIELPKQEIKEEHKDQEIVVKFKGGR